MAPATGSRARTFVWPGVLAVGALGLFVERLVLIARGLPIGNDESFYFVHALEWLGRATASIADPHRGPGTTALLTPVVAFSERVGTARLWFTLFGMLLCALTYLVGARVMPKAAAAWSALLFGLFWVTVFTSVQLLPDVPAAVFTAASIYLYRRALTDPERLGAVWPVGLTLAGAFFFNGAHAAFAGLIIAVHMLIFRRKQILTKPVFVAAGVLAAAMIPYFIAVWIGQGSPLAAIASSLAGSKRLGGPIGSGNPGYVDYAHWFFDRTHLFGWVLGVAIVIGFAATVFSAITGKILKRSDATLIALWATFAGLGMALLFHAEERYMFVAYPAVFLCLGTLATAATRVRVKRGNVVAWMALLAFAGWVGATQYSVASARATRWHVNEGYVGYTARHLDAMTHRPCAVFVRYAPQFNALTPCVATRYFPTPKSMYAAIRDRSSSIYYVSFERGKNESVWLPQFLAQHATLVATLPKKTFLGKAFIWLGNGTFEEQRAGAYEAAGLQPPPP